MLMVDAMSAETARVIIAEDERTIARHLSAIARSINCNVCEVVASSEAISGAIERHSPEILLLDISLERHNAGLDVAESGVVPDEVSIVFVSAATDPSTLERVQAIAPAGFVVKPFTEAQVIAAIRVALGTRKDPEPPASTDLAADLEQARRALSRIARELELVGHLLGPTLGSARKIRDLPELASLSSREWEVLRGLVDHKRPPVIARELYISPHTVRNHLKSIFSKLDVHSQAELVERVLARAET